MMNPAVPPVIEEIITKFDQANAPLDEHDVQQALIAARTGLSEPGEAASLGAWSEVLAFALTPSRHHPGPWKTYFGPVGSQMYADGSQTYFPDIAGTDPEAIAHWTQRAKTMKHPVLKARYADLAWDMSRVIANTKPDLEMARTAIDAYLASLVQNLRTENHGQFEAAVRALDMAVAISDAVRIEAAKKVLLGLHREAVDGGQPRWWVAVDRLLDDKRAGVTNAERDMLIADMETVVARRSGTSDPAVFDPHVTEDAAKRLIKHYSKTGKGGDAKRLHAVIGRAFEHFGSLGNAMLAASVFQTAINHYRDAGLQSESQRMRVAMEQKIEESHGLMKPTTFEHQIPKEDIEAFLKIVVVEDLATTFVRIAAEFLESRSRLEKQVGELMTQSPLMATITQTIMAEKHVAGLVGGVNEDPVGRLLQQSAQAMSLNDFWLIRSLDHAIKVHNILPAHIVTWAVRTKLFDDLTLLMEGVTAWHDLDFIKAVHVLVPQVEHGLRNIVSTLGKPVTKPHPTIAGVSVAKGMGDILYAKDITDALGPDLTLHFLTLYADPRGFNLRNDLAHGLLDARSMNFPVATRVIHTLLVLGIWDQLAVRHKPKTE